MGTYSIGRAQIELFKLEANTNKLDKTDIFAWMTKQGVPVSVTIRLEELWNTTKTIAGQVVHLGKILLLKILDFIKSHQYAIIGILIGAAIAALSSLIPAIAPMLAAISPVHIIGGAAYGLVAGDELDYRNGIPSNTFDNIILEAKKYFMSFVEIINCIFHKFENNTIGG